MTWRKRDLISRRRNAGEMEPKCVGVEAPLPQGEITLLQIRMTGAALMCREE
jgi:hypothetical protein